MDASRTQVVNVLAREGEYWTVVFGGRVSRVRDAKGLHYLEHLVRRPGEEVHALALIAAVDPPAPAPAGAGPVVDRADGLAAGPLADAGPVLDAQAIAAYRRRFLELREELADAEEAGDEVRLGTAQDELDALAAQLGGGTGLGGRARRAGSPAERARLAVTKAVRAAVRRLEQADPQLGRHLQRTVRTGTFCAYVPDPAVEVVWRSDPPAGHPAPVPRRRPARSTPFVGRALERGLVRELVAAAAGGRGGLLLLSGEAGIGKTRLVEEALADAGTRGMAAVVGRCVDVQPAIAWLPLVEALEQLFDDVPDEQLGPLLAGTGPQVAKVVPALRRRMPGLPPPADVPVEHDRLFLYASLRELFLRLGSSRPALVVLEDLHWADPATIQMLQHVVGGLEAARVLVIATYRSDEATLGTPLAQTVERLVRHPVTTSLVLGRMPAAEVVELVAGLTGQPPPAAFAGRLAAEADGNPFFVEELVKHLAAERPISTGDLPVPESLRLLLGHKLQRLSPPARELVNLVGVAGRDVAADLVAGALGIDEERLVDAVDDALAVGVLVPAGAGEDELAFGHALMRQAALAELSPLRRRRLHYRLATALRNRHGEDPEHAGEIADHLAQAGAGADPADLLRFLELAGRRSLESAAYEDALDRFRRALELAPAGDAGARARLLAGLGYAQRGTGSHDCAHASWMDALALLEASAEPDRALAAELSRALGRYLDATGGLNQAVAVLERGLQALGAKASAERSRLTAALSYVHTLRGDIAGAGRWLDEASAIAEMLDDDRLRADVLASRTSLEFATGRLRECVATAKEAEHALLAAGQVWDAVQAKVTTAWPRLWLGDAGDARRHVGETLPMAERIGHVPAVFLARRSANLVDLVVTGDLERFAASAAEGLAFCRDHRLRWLADAYVLVGLVEFWRGDWAVASDHLEAALTTPAPPVYAGRYGASLLAALAWAGDHTSFDRVLATIRADLQRIGPGPTLGATAVTLAEVEGQALLGRHQAAAALYPAVVSALDAGYALRPPDLRIVEALAGVAAGLAGDHGRAGAHFARARSIVTTLPHPRQRPDVDFLQGLSLAGADARRGRDLLEAAAAGYGELGMPRHRARAEAAMTG